MPWFQLIPNGNPLVPADYNPGTTNPPACPGSGHICSISADADSSNQPVINEPLKDAMLLALQNDSDLPNVLLRGTA